MTAVMTGVDPHKGSHTAVATGPAGQALGRLRVKACPDQAGQLLTWARAWPQRTWAVEGAAGLGRLLAQQLATAGERVLDVPPKLASRVRLLESGDVNKNDPSDARSVAIAALRSRIPRLVAADDHAVVLKITAPPTRPALFTSWLRAPLIAVTWMACPGAVAWAGPNCALPSWPRMHRISAARSCVPDACGAVVRTVPSRRPELGSSAHRAAVLRRRTARWTTPGLSAPATRRVLRGSPSG
jgi:transposase